MKILHLLYSGLGGHGNVFFSMVRADKEHAFEHEALFNGIEEVREEYRQRCGEQNINWGFVKKKPGLDLGFYYRLVKSVRRAKPGILFLHGSTQVLWAKMAVLFSRQRCRIIVRETQANHLKTKQDWLWLTVALVLADKTVFLSEAYRDEIKKKLRWVFREKKTAVIPNGIDLKQFSPAPVPDTGTLIIGMQSRVVPIKDHATLLRAFAGLVNQAGFRDRQVQLRIAGDGESRPGLEQLAEELGIRSKVIFPGMITEPELVKFLQGLHVYVHASLGETMSTAIMQAMACRLPIIASDVPGISNMLIHNNTGLLVPAKDASAMQQALYSLLTDKALAGILAGNAYQYAADHYSNEIMFNRYKAIF